MPSNHSWNGEERRSTFDAEDIMQQIHKEIAALSEINSKAKEEIIEAMKDHINDDDHRFIKMLRKKEQRKQEMWEKLKGNFIFYITITATGGIGIAIWEYLKEHLK